MAHYTRKAALLLSFLLVFGGLKAQDLPAHDFILSGQGHYGYIISHRNNISHLIKGHIYGAEINYIFRTNGCKPWHQTYNFPELGVCVLHMYLANPQQLGTMEAFYPYTNLRLNRSSKKGKFNLRLGAGLTWLTKHFDAENNHKNNAIGSSLNGFVNIRLSYARMLSKSLRIDAGVGLTHASNGAMETPNLGLNMATLNLGLGYAFGNKDIQCVKDTVKRSYKKWHPTVIVVAGARELEQPDGPKYLAFGAQLNMNRSLNAKNMLGLGVESAYSNATRRLYENDSVLNVGFSDIVTVGAKVNYAFVFNRLSLPVEFGYYLYKKEPTFGKMFHRIGLRYMINKHLIANVTLHTHWARADYFEWGIGYEL